MSYIKEKPLISVIMGIYNCSNTLEEAIDCIIHQSYSNWELIMCDDCSTDNTLEVALKIQKNNPDCRIKILQNQKNKGLNYTLNKCLDNSSGEFIARMDGDDVCSPERFSEELKVFETEPEISIVSSDMEFFDETGVWGKLSYPEYPIKEDFLHGNGFNHAPCMVKREAYFAVGGYTVDKKLIRVEDYHLWVKMYAAGYKGKNIHKSLYQMRDDQNAYKRRKFRYRLNASYARAIMLKEFKIPFWKYYIIAIPVIKGMLPKPLYMFLHKRKLSNYENERINLSHIKD